MESRESREIATTTLAATEGTGDSGWPQHWRRLGQPWRTQPEIDAERQALLARQRAVVVDIKNDVYPFRDVTLSRADVEWLLATHEDGRGPVDWADETQRERWGLDLRAADLSGVDLSGLPLARLRAGPEVFWISRDQPALEGGEVAAARMTDVHLAGANLTGAILAQAHMTGADLRGACLERAELYGAELERAHLDNVEAAGVRLQTAKLAGASLRGANLRGASLDSAKLNAADLSAADLSEASLRMTDLGNAVLHDARLERADLTNVSVAGASLVGAHLDGALIRLSHHAGADFARATLTGATFDRMYLSKVSLREAVLDGCSFKQTNISDCDAVGASFRGVEFSEATLWQIDFSDVCLEEANFSNVIVRDSATLAGARMARARLSEATMKHVRLDGADLRAADLAHAKLGGASLAGAQLDGATLTDAEMGVFDWYTDGKTLTVATNLAGASLRGADLTGAVLEGAALAGAHLEGAICVGVHFERADLSGAFLAGADLRRAVLDEQTALAGAGLYDRAHGGVRLAGIRWGGADFNAASWQGLRRTGDERAAGRRKTSDGTRKDRAARIADYQAAARVYRLLAMSLHDDEHVLGSPETEYLYRAQVLQRRLLWQQRSLGRWIFSLLLAALAGYGYRMWRILIAYALIITAYAGIYFLLGLSPALGRPLRPQDALLASFTAFHGRVFSISFTLGSPQSWTTALEAITGLIVESVFIAMLTQRFFGK